MNTEPKHGLTGVYKSGDKRNYIYKAHWKNLTEERTCHNCKFRVEFFAYKNFTATSCPRCKAKIET